jgi:predicted transcriptional regulator
MTLSARCHRTVIESPDPVRTVDLIRHHAGRNKWGKQEVWTVMRELEFKGLVRRIAGGRHTYWSKP